MPASECQNPLIIPLAAHELGHVVWNRGLAKKEFEPSIKKAILRQFDCNIDKYNNLFHQNIQPGYSLQNMSSSLTLSLRQVEETFCDFIALFAFGEAFLLAFRYLLAPSLGKLRNPKYPKIRDRAESLSKTALQLQFSIDRFDPASFSDQENNTSSAEAFLQQMADNATKSLIDDLLNLVKKHKGNLEQYVPLNAHEKLAESSMRNLVPPSNAPSSEAIINAAWNIRLDIDGWAILQHIKDLEARRIEKLRVLQDITLLQES